MKDISLWIAVDHETYYEYCVGHYLRTGSMDNLSIKTLEISYITIINRDVEVYYIFLLDRLG